MNKIYSGKQVELNMVEVYPRYGSKEPDKIKSGIYYLWDNIIKNNRIRITNSESGVGILGQITGWVSINNVIVDNSLKIGDKILVNGTLNTYADGTGNTIDKVNEAMYIVDIIEQSEEFKYNIAVASGPNKTKQGWCNDKIIKKYKE